MKKRNIYQNQSQELLHLFEEAGSSERVMCVPMDSVKMQTSHGTVQGYNGQAIVDSKHQVIVHGEAIGKGPDNDNLPPVVDGAK